MLMRIMLLALFLVCGQADAVTYHAVCVGINNYNDDDKDLTKCVDSATKFFADLRDSLGWSQTNMRLITDANATKSAIIDSIKAMPRSNGNICLFFFSGHGTQSGIMTPDGTALSPTELEAAFLYNTDPNYNQFCCFIDACSSGVFAYQMDNGVICAACDSNEVANYLDPSPPQNPYTFYSRLLINCLGENLNNNDVLISAEILHAYADSLISTQNPIINDNYTNGDLVLGPDPWVISNGNMATVLNNSLIPGNIIINDTCRLAINDNVTLYMENSKEIEVSGELYLGHSSSGATITKVTGGTYWAGIDLESGGSITTYGDSNIEYAVCGIDIFGGSVQNSPDKIMIQNCSQAGIWAANSSPTLTNFYFNNASNSTYQNGAITVTGTTANPTISRVTIENTYFGMRVSSTYASTSVQNSVIDSSNTSHSFQINTGGRINLNGHNNICPDYTKKAINNAASDSIHAENNYWGRSNPVFANIINIPGVVYTTGYSNNPFTTDVGAYKRAIEEINDPLYVARQLEASGDSLQAFNIYKNMMNETSDPSMKHFLITSMLRVAPCMENGLNDIRNTINTELASAKSWYKACLDFTLCNLLYREGKYSEALDAFKTKAQEYKGTPIEQEYLINIASLYGEKFGDKNTARTYADMAAAINPGESYLRLAYEAAGVNDYIPASHEYRIIDPFTGYPDSDEPEKELVSLSEDISVTPNPFNPITTISYNISTPGHVSLSIYNITGQKVATLVNGLSTTGFHSVRFDGSSLASGVYFYRFETPKFSKSGKLLLVK